MLPETSRQMTTSIGLPAGLPAAKAGAASSGRPRVTPRRREVLMDPPEKGNGRTPAACAAAAGVNRATPTRGPPGANRSDKLYDDRRRRFDCSFGAVSSKLAY